MWVCDAVIHLLSLHSCMRLSLWHCLSVAHSHWRAFCRERNVCGFQRRRYSDLCSLCPCSATVYCMYSLYVCSPSLTHSLSFSVCRSFSVRWQWLSADVWDCRYSRRQFSIRGLVCAGGGICSAITGARSQWRRGGLWLQCPTATCGSLLFQRWKVQLLLFSQHLQHL